MGNVRKSELFKQGIFIDRIPSVEKLSALVGMFAPINGGHPMVQIGTNSQAQYSIPDDFHDITACFSSEASDGNQLEAKLFEMYGLKTHLSGASSIDYGQCDHVKSVRGKSINAYDNSEFMTLNSWVAEQCCDDLGNELFLQLNVQGREYVSLLATPEATLLRFRIMVLELYNVESWGSAAFFDVVGACFSRLLELFDVVSCQQTQSASLVNLGPASVPDRFRLTFLRKDRVRHEEDKSALSARPFRIHSNYTKQLFTTIYEKHYWGRPARSDTRYYSGPGSHNPEVV